LVFIAHAPFEVAGFDPFMVWVLVAVALDGGGKSESLRDGHI
jgi:hypothetical protein